MTEFADWRPAPNIRDAPDVYEIENRAIDPDGRLINAMRTLAPWGGRRLVDLGCGTGFWLATYADAAAVIGVEPDRLLRVSAEQRAATLSNARVVAGSAEHLPVADGSVDVVHARFAYFFGAGGDAGLREVRRALSPDGALVVVDNDYRIGDFADILRVATEGNATISGDETDEWWKAQGATRTDVLTDWRFERRTDLEMVLRNEFRDGAAEAWLQEHPTAISLRCAYALYLARPTT